MLKEEVALAVTETNINFWRKPRKKTTYTNAFNAMNV